MDLVVFETLSLLWSTRPWFLVVLFFDALKYRGISELYEKWKFKTQNGRFEHFLEAILG